MSRLILNVSVATIAFIVGVASNWSVNALGGFAVDKFYTEASIPSLLQAKAVEDRNRDTGPIGCPRL